MIHINLRTKLPGPKSKRILDKLKQKNGAYHIDHPYVHSGKGSGSHFIDMDENTFLDLSGQIASNPLGYNYPELIKVVQKHAGQFPIKYGGQDFTIPQHEELLEEVLKIVPKELNAGFLINSGAEANENAIKMACRKNPRAKFGISFKNGWHGRTSGALSLTNTKAVQVKHYLKIPVKRISYDDNAPTELDDLIRRECDASEIGFIIMECVQGEGGYHPAPAHMVKEIRKLTKKYEIPLIIDEVQAGMGRTGKWWAYQHYGITPDIQTCAKALQVGATISRKNMFPKEGSALSSTWGGGHVMDLAVGAAIIREIKKKKLVRNAEQMGKVIGKRLKEIEKSTQRMYEPRGLGLMRAFDLKDTKTRNLFREKCFKKGVIVLGCGTSGIRLSPSLNITQTQINEGMTIIENVAKEMR